MSDLGRIGDHREILGLLNAERRAARGFDSGDELSKERRKVYDYYHGETSLSGDLKVESRGRSKSVSMDIADTVNSIMPDLIEIFAGGDNIVEFQPHGEEDVEPALQETDYVNHVFWEQNAGFMILYDAFQDALLAKTGIFRWSWKESEEEVEFEELTAEEFAEIARKAVEDDTFEIKSVKITIGDQTFDSSEALEQAIAEAIEAQDITLLEGLSQEQSVNIKAVQKAEGVEIVTVAPEDFGVDKDAVSIETAMVVFEKQRPTAFELLQRDIPKEKIDKLQQDQDADSDSETVRRARSTFETNEDQVKANRKEARTIEVFEYHADLAIDGDDVKTWRILTGNNDTMILEAEIVSSKPYATICPYPVAHEFYGQSMGDLLLSIQQVNTALTRAALDHAYYAVNPRPYVDMTQVSETTTNDLALNVPGSPIRGNGPEAVKYLTPAQLSFDIFNALEYFATKKEEATGVARNAQGLNPDTLHDTASGAHALMSRAQVRMKMIARIFGETGIKDLFRGVHDFLQLHSNFKKVVRLRGKWATVEPNRWNRRKDLKVSVGLGSNTKQQQLAFLDGWLERMERVRQLQGGQGPFIFDNHIYNATRKLVDAAGFQNTDAFVQDPNNLTDEQKAIMAAEREQGPPPDPEIVKAQIDAQTKLQVEREKLALEAKKSNDEKLLTMWQTLINAGQKEDAMRLEAELKVLDIATNSDTKVSTAAINAASRPNGSLSNIRPGGGVGSVDLG